MHKHHFELYKFWQSMPQELGNHMLLGTSGTMQCLNLATLALESLSRHPFLYGIPDFLLAAYEYSPEDTALAQQLLQLPASILSLPAETLLQLKAVTLAPTQDDLPQGVQHWFAANTAWNNNDYQQAYNHYTKVGGSWLIPVERAGYCCMYMGETAAAVQYWMQVLVRRPWHLDLARVLYDVLKQHFRIEYGSEAVTVLLQCHDNAQQLDSTLQSLSNSFDNIAKIICLENGTSADTVSVCMKWEQQLSPKFSWLTTPTYIGRAAAKNWLASLPDVRRHEYVAMIASGVTLPKDWLQLLLYAKNLYPQAQTWGCQNITPEAVLGPGHLCANFDTDTPQPRPERDPEAVFSPLWVQADPFSLSNTQQDQVPLPCIVPCCSTPPQCQLMRTQSLINYPFSLQYAPEYDADTARDLDILRHGGHACFTGFCTVRAPTDTLKNDDAAVGNTIGNAYKLHGQFEPADIISMLRQQNTFLSLDIERKLLFLDTVNPNLGEQNFIGKDFQ